MAKDLKLLHDKNGVVSTNKHKIYFLYFALLKNNYNIIQIH